jgi:hypothetical protein
MKNFKSQTGLAPVIILIIVLVASGIIGGGIYMSNQKSQSTGNKMVPSTVPESAMQPTDESPKADGSTTEINSNLLQLLAKNQSMECDWTPPAMENVKISKIWVSDNKARSHIEASTGNMPIIADAVFKDGGLTTWVEAGQTGKIGFKMTKEEIAEASAKAEKDMTAEEKKQAEAYMKETRYSCKSWTPDSTKFEVPADVKFYTQ